LNSCKMWSSQGQTVQVFPVPMLAEQTPRHPHSCVRHHVQHKAELACTEQLVAAQNRRRTQYPVSTDKLRLPTSG
jgi:hypothetical protein